MLIYSMSEFFQKYVNCNRVKLCMIDIISKIFCRKKFKRVRAENIEELLKASNATASIAHFLQNDQPTFSFTRNDEETFTFQLQTGERVMNTTFKLGEETELERRDGTKVNVTYTLESDNVLKQVIKSPDGKISYFRREFGDNDVKMTINVEGIDVAATIFYENVK